MTTVISAFRDDVRDILGDKGTDRRHADEDIDRAVVDAFRRMFSIRPDSRIYTGVLVDYEFPTSASDLASFQVQFDPRWRTGIVYHAAARRYEADTIDAVNRELAAAYFKRADEVFAS